MTRRRQTNTHSQSPSSEERSLELRNFGDWEERGEHEPPSIVTKENEKVGNSGNEENKNRKKELALKYDLQFTSRARSEEREGKKISETASIMEEKLIIKELLNILEGC